MFTKLPPHPCLANVVDHYWIEQNGKNHMRVLPDGTASVIFNLGSPINIYGINGDYKGLESNFIIGAQKKYYFLEENANTYVVGVKFTQGGAYHFLKHSMKDFSDKVVNVNDILEWDVDKMTNQLKATQSGDTIKKILDYNIIMHADMIEGNSPVVNRAIKAVKENDSPALIRSFCEKQKISNKHLISLFDKKVGISPKLLQRLSKFTKIIFAVQNRKTFDWPQLAYEYNYYDQAHLINEFKSFSGLSPKQYYRNNISGLRVFDERI